MRLISRLAIYLNTLLLVIFLTGGDLHSQTKEIENQKEKIKQIEADISYLDNQILATQKKKKNTLDELVLIQRKVANRKKLLAELDAQIKGQTREIAQIQKNISALGKRLDTLEHYYRNMVYNAYKHRDTRLWFMYILASENFDQGYRRWSYLKNYSKTINSQAEKIRELKEERSAELEKLEKIKADNILRQKARKKEYDKFAAEEKQQRAFAKSLDKKQSQYRSQLAKKRQEASRLAKEVERMIAAEIKRQQELARMAQKREQNSNQPQQQKDIGRVEFEEYASNTKLSGSFSLNKGKLPFPVAQGVVVEQFGIHPHPTLKNVKLPFNNGINISTKPGSGVKAVFDGVVKQVIAIPGYNQCVLVQHGQYFTFYCKLAKVTVKVGDKVSTGETLGNLESGGSTATLHFELWNGTTKQNPELWLKK
ncbi:MAG: peptidoglycan DD-metalloendopeptidase family protein [Bacteroidales bacterium]|nr:peptidoglycan DD-metalloendopeptidase family protein [Bacteroidales bacterium]MBQ5827307.1 peptidoglycan DD-metalloendopeptidase family protein [Bacteroidales bacterium]